MSNKRIGVFDSGVGGITIAGAIIEVSPWIDLHCVADNLNFPYGAKSESQVIEIVNNLIHKFLETNELDIIVVACNTASTVCLVDLRRRHSQDIVGVVPAIKPAANASKTKIIGLLATPGTVSVPYTDDLIREFAPEHRVLKCGTSELVQMAEAKLRGVKPDLALLRSIIEPMFVEESGQKTDHIVLGCTHFPLLLAELIAVAPWPVNWVDSSSAIANRIKMLLGKSGIIASNTAFSPKRSFYFTNEDSTAIKLIPELTRLGFQRIGYL